MDEKISHVETLLKHDRKVVTIALIIVVSVTLAYTLAGMGMEMSAFEMSGYPWAGPFGKGNIPSMAADVHFTILLSMWWLMMIAMMLPSAAPVILLTAAINRRSNLTVPPFGSVASFTLGYLTVWLIFSVAATLTHKLLESHGYLNAMMQSNNRTLSGVLLVAAGIWQFTPIKQACLRHCRSPVEYITYHKKPGNSGALRMGLGHGAYCLGCCWFLMAILFAGGVMNLYWIAGLALFVLIEKQYSKGVWFGRLAGGLLILAGIGVLAN
jgi:predicted metal-binding membrane protein